MTFDDALDAKGEAHEVTQSNSILLQMNEDRVLRKMLLQVSTKASNPILIFLWLSIMPV